MPQNKPPILLKNPPASMPAAGTKDYELLLEETGGAAANEGFNYELHIAATRPKSDPTPTPEPTPKAKDPMVRVYISEVESGNELITPQKGTLAYQQLLEETDGAAANEGFNYEAHLAATGQVLFADDDPRSSQYADTPGYAGNRANQDDLLYMPNIDNSTPDPTPTPEPTPKAKDPMVRVYISEVESGNELITPQKGTLAYQQLLEETDGAAANEGFNYEAHLAATGQVLFADDDPRSSQYADTPGYAGNRANQDDLLYMPNIVQEDTKTDTPKENKPLIYEGTDALGNTIAPVYLLKAPTEMPKKGTEEYELLEKEIGTEIPEGFNYIAHIAATRKPKDYPDWLDPVVDIDDRWVDPSKLNTSKTYEKELEEYSFFRRSDGSIEIKTEEGFDEITGIPKLQFADKAVSAIAEIEATFDQIKAKDDVTGKMFRVYNAAFNRFPDSDGLEYWIEKNGSGENTERQVAESFLASNEFKEKYGEDVSNEQYVKTLYQNILDREPDLEGYNYWVGQLKNGIEDRSELLLGFAESTENQTLFSEVTGLY